MLEAFGLSDPGCVRQNNEDFYLISPKDRLYIVADGMGGAQAGEHASKLAVETVASFLQNAPAPDAQTLFQAFREANQQVMKASASNPELEGMGTTLVAALESGPELLIASVGDSRAYVFVGGELKAITEDQTWVNEVGRIWELTNPPEDASDAARADHGDRRQPRGARSVLHGPPGAWRPDPAFERRLARRN